MNKRVSFFFLTVLLTLLLPGISCKKEKVTTINETSITTEPPPPPPPPDPYVYSADLQSSKDISFANYTVSDIEMISSFLGENVLSNTFYSPASSGSGTVTAIRYEMAKQCIMSFNNTSCADGKNRSGTVYLNFGPPPGAPPPPPGPGPMFIRDPGFEGRISFSDYSVGSWKVELFDTKYPLIIRNLLTGMNYDPSTTNITWRVAGKLKLINGNDTIVWDGSFTKTLENTSDPNVFSSDKKSAIKWSLASINYTDTVWGSTKGHVFYKYGIDRSNPLKRDFTCSPLSSTIHFHPFIKGKTLFYTSNYHPRTINYGPDENCDNKGKVAFKDETHDIEFDQ